MMKHLLVVKQGEIMDQLAYGVHIVEDAYWQK
jgi:hypothetical protein